VLIVHNPGSTQPENYKLLAHELFDNGFDHDIIPTERDVAGMRANIEAADPRPDDIFAVVTGDGGFNVFSQAAIRMGLSNYVITREGGKANDNTHSHNQGRDFFDILKNGVPARAHPLDMFVSSPGKPEAMHRAMAYFGVHGTALAARALEQNRGEIRQLRDSGKEFAAKRMEAFTSLDAVADAPPITVEYDGRLHELADLTFCGISRMAREGRVHANPFSPDRFRRLVTPSGGRIGIASRMSLLAVGLFFGDDIRGETQARLYSEDGRAMALHVDGEVAHEGRQLEVMHDSSLVVAKSDTYINVWTSRRRLARQAVAVSAS
jgi:hypothetical protein